jgi:hypothetical protein
MESADGFQHPAATGGLPRPRGYGRVGQAVAERDLAAAG